jgi:hypothetical protein
MPMKKLDFITSGFFDCVGADIRNVHTTKFNVSDTVNTWLITTHKPNTNRNEAGDISN